MGMNKVLERVLREIDALPLVEQERIARVLQEEVRQAQRTSPKLPSRWARLAERLDRESPLEGKSEEFLRQVREFRGGFAFGEPKNAE